MRFRKKSVEVDAVQWWPKGDPQRDACSGHELYQVVQDRGPTATLKTVSEPMLWPGDWIVDLGDNRCKHMKEAEFLKAYEPVGDES